jgi:hypothetical protein
MTGRIAIEDTGAVAFHKFATLVSQLSAAKPHQNAAVKWLPGDGRFQCSKHDSR